MKLHEEFGEQVGSKVVFENDKVRIWEMRLPAGESGPLHAHRWDHICIQISGDRMAVVPHPKTQSPYNEYMEADVVPGQFFVVPKGAVEVAKNVGQQDFHEIIVELKD